MNTFRLSKKKDLPKLLVFRRLLDGKPGQGIFMMDEGKFNGYSGAKFIAKVIQSEKAALSATNDPEMRLAKDKANDEKLGYREVIIDLWNNSCAPSTKEEGEEKA